MVDIGRNFSSGLNTVLNVQALSERSAQQDELRLRDLLKTSSQAGIEAGIRELREGREGFLGTDQPTPLEFQLGERLQDLRQLDTIQQEPDPIVRLEKQGEFFIRRGEGANAKVAFDQAKRATELKQKQDQKLAVQFTNQLFSCTKMDPELCDIAFESILGRSGSSEPMTKALMKLKPDQRSSMVRGLAKAVKGGLPFSQILQTLRGDVQNIGSIQRLIDLGRERSPEDLGQELQQVEQQGLQLSRSPQPESQSTPTLQPRPVIFEENLGLEGGQEAEFRPPPTPSPFTGLIDTVDRRVGELETVIGRRERQLDIDRAVQLQGGEPTTDIAKQESELSEARTGLETARRRRSIFLSASRSVSELKPAERQNSDRVIQASIRGITRSGFALTKEGAEVVKNLQAQVKASADGKEKISPQQLIARLNSNRSNKGSHKLTDEQQDNVRAIGPVDADTAKSLFSADNEGINEEKKQENALERTVANFKEKRGLQQQKDEARGKLTRLAKNLDEQKEIKLSDLATARTVLKTTLIESGKNERSREGRSTRIEGIKLQVGGALQRTKETIKARREALKKKLESEEQFIRIKETAKGKRQIQSVLDKQLQSDQDFQQQAKLKEIQAALDKDKISYELGITAARDFEAMGLGVATDLLKILVKDNKIEFDSLFSGIRKALEDPQQQGLAKSIFEAMTEAIRENPSEDFVAEADAIASSKLSADNKLIATKNVLRRAREAQVDQDVLSRVEARVNDVTDSSGLKLTGTRERNLAIEQGLDPDNILPTDRPAIKRINEQVKSERDERLARQGTGSTAANLTNANKIKFASNQTKQLTATLRRLVQENPQVVGAVGSIRSAITGAVQQGQLASGQFRNFVLTDSQTFPIDDGAMKKLNQSGFQAVITNKPGDEFNTFKGILVYMVARLMDDNGRLSDNDVERAQSVVGDGNFVGPDQFLNVLGAIDSIADQKAASSDILLGRQPTSIGGRSVQDMTDEELEAIASGEN